MTKWLASVQTLAEVKAISACLPDIVDMKLPEQGALGALPTRTVSEIVVWLNKRCLTSATIGDLPMQAEYIVPALQDMANTGVDFVKIGLFNSLEMDDCIEALTKTVSSLSVPVIAVMFADQTSDLGVIQRVKKAGFAGIMVDTASKDGQGLLDHWPLTLVNRFITEARQQSLLCGLAGALKIEDITLLKGLGADYLGFRSALCHQRLRTSELQAELAKKVQFQLQEDLDQAV